MDAHAMFTIVIYASPVLGARDGACAPNPRLVYLHLPLADLAAVFLVDLGAGFLACFFIWFVPCFSSRRNYRKEVGVLGFHASQTQLFVSPM